MDMIFFNRVATSNASTNCRNGLRDFVLKNPEAMPDLIAIGTDLTNKNHYKAVWIIEMLAEQKTKILIPFVRILCETMANYKHESAIRGMSRVAYFLSTSKDIALTENQKVKVIEICLDWFIGDAKVAPKVYAMYTLCHYAQNEDWIKEALCNFINKDYLSQSAGYKAAAKEVLKKINH